MSRLTALLLAAVLPAAPGGSIHQGPRERRTALPAAGSGDWREAVVPHYHIRYRTPFLPSGFLLSLERMHNRLRMDLAGFSPWMAKERISLYLYADAGSYRAGEFRPPAWSNGVAFYRRKLVAVYDQPDRGKLLEVISHEMAHLFFESYWGEEARVPPQWLNEGLAMMEETEGGGGVERSEWYRSLAQLPAQRLLPLDTVVRLAPAKDLKGKEEVAYWYLQAFSLVYFLSRRHTRMQFHNFCERLRGGRSLNQALWEAYRYPGLAGLEKVWRAWLRPAVVSGKRGGGGTPGLAEGPRTDGRLRRVDFRGFEFHGLRED